MRAEMIGGQYLDLLGQAAGDGTVDSALRVTRYKTAKYTIERPLHLGEALARLPDGPIAAALTAYGIPLGIAFQLRDDVLGVFGDPAGPESLPVTTCARASGRSCSRSRGTGRPRPSASARPQAR